MVLVEEGRIITWCTSTNNISSNTPLPKIRTRETTGRRTRATHYTLHYIQKATKNTSLGWAHDSNPKLHFNTHVCSLVSIEYLYIHYFNQVWGSASCVYPYIGCRITFVFPFCNFSCVYLLFSLWYFPANGQIGGTQHYGNCVIQMGKWYQAGLLYILIIEENEKLNHIFVLKHQIPLHLSLHI